MRVQIIADSACDLPLDLIALLKIKTLPLVIQIDGNEYFDLETIQPNELYMKMRDGKIPKTAQVPPARFEEAFSDFAEKKQPCIYISFSSELSGTYQTSTLVRNDIIAKYPDFDLTIIDSRSASLGCGLIVKKAAEMAQEGKSKVEILEMVMFYTNHMEHLITVDSLDYLYRGGRISKTSAFVGGFLNIKPILNIENGKLVPLEKIKGRKKVLKRMIELMDNRARKSEEQCIAICHADDIESAETMQNLITEQLGCNSFLINTIGCTIGAHVGPGTLAVCF